jgi:hypothetical protein
VTEGSQVDILNYTNSLIIPESLDQEFAFWGMVSILNYGGSIVDDQNRLRASQYFDVSTNSYNEFTSKSVLLTGFDPVELARNSTTYYVDMTNEQIGLLEGVVSISFDFYGKEGVVFNNSPTMTINVPIREEKEPGRNFAIRYAGVNYEDNSELLIPPPFQGVFNIGEIIDGEFASLGDEEIGWTLNGQLQLGEDVAEYEVGFREGGGVSQVIEISVSYSLALTINIRLDVPPLPEGYIYDQNDNRVVQGLQLINAQNTGLYNGPIGNGRSIEIQVLPSLPPIVGLENSVLYGDASAAVGSVGNRLFIIPGSIQSEESGRYEGCPTGATVGAIITESQFDEIFNSIVDQTGGVPLIVDRIYDSNTAQRIRDWIENGGAEAVAGIGQLNGERQLYFEPNDAEIEEMVRIEFQGVIRLNAQGLNDLVAYGKVPPGESLIMDEGAWKSRWVNDNSTRAQALINQKWTMTLAHEIQHLNWKWSNKRQAFIWSHMVSLLPNGTYSVDCYPARRRNDMNYCSSAGGHEFSNPDGQETCAIEGTFGGDIYLR